MANIQLKIVGLGDFSSVNQQLKQVQTQVNLLSKSIAGIGLSSNLTKELNTIQAEFKAAMVSSGNFTAHTVKLTSETEKFGRALQSGKLKLGEYFGIITGRSAAAKKQVEALAIEQVKLNNSIVTQDITKQGIYSVYTPTAINKVAKATEIAAARQNIFNLAVREGSQQLINFGKNTQWAGRQLTVGLSMPVLLFGSQAMKTFQEVNDQLVRLQKVYGTGLVRPTEKALAQIKSDTVALSKELASTMGVAAKDTAAMAADLAATGKTGIDLMNATREAMRLARLGELDTQAAMGATISLQNVYKLSTQELSGAVDFLNAVENQTSTSLQDLVDGIPRVGPIVQQLGGDFKDTALMMVAMKEAGVPAAQSANAIKSALASIINPTKKAREEFAAYNINLAGIAESTGGNPIKMIMGLQQALKGLSSLNQAQLIETLFGKFQQARVQALITNLGAVNSQTRTAYELASASAPELAAMAASEMKVATESTTGKFRRAVETLKADLIPVGEKIMEVATKILEFGSSIANFFNKLPGPIKSGLGILLTLGAIAGPVIMITGLFANLMGQVMRVGYSLWGVLDGSRKWKDLMTPTGIAAKAATDVFQNGLMANVGAVETLNASITRLIMNIEGITTAMAVSTGVVAAGETAVASRLLLPGMPGFRKKMATGGIVPGMGNQDTVPALLTPGEYVIPKAMAQRYSPFLSAMISGNLPRHAMGRDKDGNPLISTRNYGGQSGAQFYRPGSGPEFIAEQGLVGPQSQIDLTRVSGSRPLPSWAVQTPDESYNTALGSGKADPQGMLDFQKLAGEAGGGVGQGGGVHSALYEFLERGTTLTPAEKAEILQNADDNLKSVMQGMVDRGEKLGDDKLGIALEDSYRDALAPNFEKDPKLKEAFDKESSYINGVRNKRLNESGTSFTRGGPVAGAMGVRDRDVIIPIEQDLNAAFEKRTGIKGSTTSHTPFRGFFNRIRSSSVAGIRSFRGLSDINQTGESNSSMPDQAADKAVMDAINAGKKKAKIKSPSELAADEIGIPLAQGIGKGIEEGSVHIDKSMDEAIDESVNSPSRQSKLQSKFSKAFGPQSRLGAMMSNPMGRVGASMGLTMGMQMIAPMISSKLGDTAGGMMNSAMSGASMGMAFGPWGAAAGAAIGLVSSGIGKLIELEKLHKAQNDALWKPSADAAAFFGLTVADVTHTMTNFTNITSGARDAVDSLSTGLTYSNTQLDSFKKMLEALPENNELNLVIGSMKDAKTNEAAKALAQQFVQIQMAVNGMNQTQANQLLQMMLTMSGKSATGANVGVKTQAEAIINMLNAAKGNSERLSTLIGQITNVASNTTGWEAYKVIIDAIGKSAGSSSEMVAALISYLKSVGDVGGAALTENLSRAGYSIKEIENLKMIWKAGIKASTDNLVPGSKLIDQLAKQAKLILDKAKATKSSTDAVTGLTAAEKANVDALKEKKKILDAELKSLKDKLKAEQDLQSFNTTTTDIKNQILLAQASGDNLKAQLLQQQLIAKGQEYTAQNIINDKQSQSDLLGEQIANAMAKGNEKLGSDLGANSTATNNNTDAIKEATPEGSATRAPRSLTSPNDYGSMGGGDGVSSAEVNKYISQRNKENPKLKLPAYGGDKWEEVIGKGKPGEGKTGLTGDAIRYMVEHGNDGKGYEEGDQFTYNGLTYNVTRGASSALAGSAEVLPDASGPTASKAQQYNWANPYKLDAKTLQSWMNDYNARHSLKQGMPAYLYLEKLIKNGKWNNKGQAEEIVELFTKAGLEQGQYLSFNNIRYRVKRLTAGSGGADIVSHGPIKKADGGHISGPGSGTSDSIPALLSNGEYVIKASSVSKYGKDMFDSLNAGHFANGGQANKNGWLQKWAKSLSGMPAAEMLGTASLLRKIAGVGKKGDTLSALTLPLNFAGMTGAGRFGVGQAFKSLMSPVKSMAYKPVNTVNQYSNYFKAKKLVKEGQYHGSSDRGRFQDPPLSGISVLDGTSAYDPHYGMGFFSTSSKAEADLYAGGYNVPGQWGESYGSMNQVTKIPFGKYIDYRKKNIKSQNYMLWKLLQNKDYRYAGENLGSLMDQAGTVGSIMPRISAGRTGDDTINNAIWIALNNSKGTTLKEIGLGFANGGMVPFPKYSLPSFDVGTSYVPHDMIAQIHKGEAIIPANQNNGTMGETNITIYAQNASAIEVAREVENILNRKAGMSGKTTLVGVNR